MTAEPIWRRLVVTLLALVLAPLSVLLVAGPASADEDAQITGHVTDTGDLPLENVLVTAYQHDGDTWQPIGSATTDDTGLYTLETLELGDYRLEFFDCSCTYVPGFWTSTGLVADVVDAETITLAPAGSAVADAQLVAYGVITGHVSGSGGDLEDTWVHAYLPVVPGMPEPEYVGSALTDADGTYRIEGLTSGGYLIHFEDSTGAGHLDEWWDEGDGAADLNLAVPVDVELEQVVTGIDAALAEGGHIAGRVTDEAEEPNPLQDIEINVFRYDADAEDWSHERRVTTDAAGEFDVDALRDGRYRVELLDPDQDYLTEYWDDATDLESATDIDVTGPGTTDLDVALATAGHITGRVLGDGLVPSGVDASIAVRRAVEGGGLEWAGRFYAESDGTFDIAGLAPGDYQLLVADDAGDYLPEYWDDSPTAGGADLVTVGSGESVALPHDVVLAEAASLGGVVTDPEGNPLSVVLARAHRWNGEAWEFAGYAYTDESGAFTITGLAPGTFRLEVHDDANRYLGEFWQDAATLDEATDLVLAPGADHVLSEPVALSTGGAITGTVTTAGAAPGDPDVPRVGAYIEVTKAVDDGAGGTTWEYVATSSTDGAGTYAIAGLAAGDYRLYFYDNDEVLPEYWNDAATAEQATTIHLSPQEVVADTDVRLDRAGRIGGVVASAGPSPTPIAGVAVRLYAEDPASGWDFRRSTTTSADGSYVFGGLRPGIYTIEFDGSPVSHTTRYWDGRSTLEEADPIELGPGEAVDAGAQLPTGASISGRVTDGAAATETPVEGIYVTLMRGTEVAEGEWDWGWEAATSTDAAGDYEFSGLAPGVYRVTYSDFEDVYFQQFWPGAASMEEAESIVLGEDEARGDVDAPLVRAARIGGTVTDAEHTALAGVHVQLYRWDGDDETWREASSDTTASDGGYELRGLRTGTYTLQFADGSDNLLIEFWEDQEDLSTATEIQVETGETLTADAALDSGGRILGTVLGDGGVGLADIEVSAWRYDGAGDWTMVRSAQSDAEGEYVIDLLRTGNHRLRFDGGSVGHRLEWWQDQPDVSAAADVAVTTGSDITLDAAQLSTGGHITGVVRDGTGDPFEGVSVTAHRVDGDSGTSYSATTDGDGAYDIGLLPSGDYKLEFVDGTGAGHLPEWWDDAADAADADSIAVSDGGIVADRDAQLTAGSRITGTVTGEGGGAVGGARLSLYRPDGDDWNLVGWYYAGGDGSFDIRGLPAGDYRLLFEDPSGDHLPEHWDDAETVNGGQTITVGAGETASGIDPELAPAARISGHVSDDDGDLDGVEVVVWLETGPESWQRFETDWTASDGTYAIGDLPAGTYRVGFLPSGGTHVREYYDDSPTFEGEDTEEIVLTAGERVSGIDARLTRAGRIAGSVVDSTDAPVGGIAAAAFVWDDDAEDWRFVDDDWTDEDGTYAIGGLRQGTYRVFFYEEGDTYLSQAYRSSGSAPTVEEGDDIEVLAGETASGIDTAVSTGSHITGTVTGPQDEGVQDVAVTALRWNGATDQWVPARTADTADDGDYDLGRLHAGTYRLRFDDQSGNDYDTEFWDDVTDLDEATDVEVDLQVRVEDVDAQLTRAVANLTRPTIEGDALVGETLTVSSGTWDPGTGLELAYQWQRDGLAIAGADESTYELTTDDVGEPIAVEVTASATGYRDGVATSLATDDVVLPEIENTAVPTISGLARVGSVLTASAGAWTPGAGLTLRYQWLADGAPVGADAATYAPTIGDIGKTIRVRVTASRTDWVEAEAISAPTGTVQPADFTVSAPPAIGGTPRVGAPLSVSAGTWAPAPDLVSYQWRVGGTAIAGATGASYTPVAADAGRQLDVLVTATKAGHTAASVATAPVTVTAGTIAATVKPTLTGKVKRGAKLVVKPGTWSPAGGKVTLQWYAGKKQVAKATKATLKLTGRTLKAVTRKVISVRITVSAPGYASTTVTLKAKGKIKPVRLTR